MIHAYKGHHPVIGQGVYIAEGSHVIGKTTLGDEANVWFGAVIRGDDNTIAIGARTNVQDNTTVHVSGDHPTVIGDDVTIGHNCIIHGCTIKDTCLIGMGSTVLDGAVIGKNSIVGANSLVTMNKTFPEGQLIMGSPAKVIRPLTEEEIQGLNPHAKHYVSLAKTYNTLR